MIHGSPNLKKRRILKSRNKTITVTIGDPCGIGPEVVIKALRALRIPQNVTMMVIADTEILNFYKAKESKQISFYPVCGFTSFLKTIGSPGKESGLASKTYLDCAIRLIKSGVAQALVTAPLSKEAVAKTYPRFEGHTEYLAEAFGVKNVEMMFVTDQLKTVIATRHVALKNVPAQIDRKKVFDVIDLTHRGLTHLFKMRNPKIGVCGLNPHAGEGGIMGWEDKEKILPAIIKAKKKKISAFGPISADTAFAEHNRQKFDAIIAMYHDQGLAPVKALYFDKLVNLTVGIPFIRTSPVHGTAFDIAGKNKADASSMAEAIKLAIKLS